MLSVRAAAQIYLYLYLYTHSSQQRVFRSGFWHPGALSVLTNVSEELAAYIFRVKLKLLFYSEDVGNIFLQNVGKHVRVYTASEPRRPQS
jgi:hypothetical protein